MRIVDQTLLDDLSARALASPRRRMNLNFHATAEDPCQRLLNAIEPGSYIRPHRHLALPKEEMFIAVRGRMAMVIFDDSGAVTRVQLLAPAGPVCAGEVPIGTWHTILSLAPGSVFFETKPGPYRPIAEADWGPWSPAEGDARAAAYLEELTALARRTAGEG